MSAAKFLYVILAAMTAVMISVLTGCGDDEVSKPICADYSKNGATGPTDQASCQAACQTGEGLEVGDWNGPGTCSCKASASSSSSSTICQPAS
mmetsp:Transcript_10040/g.26708  ORF Transcript_10040/g.26708 Transcript_10040/m.26708 type:complete len:93 (+) Transcript_10040:98-376(+)